MGRTTEQVRHEFLTSIKEPTPDRATALKVFLQEDKYDRMDVLVVIRGVIVSWKYDLSGDQEKYNRRLYGVRDKPFPPLGMETGFLVRHIAQWRWQSEEDHKEAQQKSWEDFHGLVLWLLLRS